MDNKTTSLSDHIDQNIEEVVELRRREWEQTTLAQRRVERIGRLIGQPVYLLCVLVVVIIWTLANVAMRLLGHDAFDPLPFAILQGLISLTALVTTTIVLVAQNRQSKLEQQHTHLGLQVTMLTEQKVTKLIHLIEELRRDLPMVKDRLDPHAVALQEAADPKRMLSAIAEGGLTDPPASLDQPQTTPAA